MRRIRLFPLLAGLVLFAGACADVKQPTAPGITPSASRDDAFGSSIRVMTRNMYLGTNIDPLLAPGADPSTVLASAFAELQHTDYPERAQRLAMEIATHHPQAVGLQEVTRYELLRADNTTQVIDFLDILQQYLAGMGAHYDVAVRQSNVGLQLPLGIGGVTALTYVDGDAILVRHDVAWSNPAKGHYPTQVHLTVAGHGFDNLRGWNAVTLALNGLTLRFVNTHMEIQAFRAVQEAQAAELATMLAAETLPVILVGDFNSAANPSAPAESKTATYHILRNAGFADIELREAHSSDLVTCCSLSDLSNATPIFDQRLDLVLARFGNAGFGGQSSIELVGATAADRFLDTHGYYLWPSDHAGVVADLWPAPGLAKK